MSYTRIRWYYQVLSDIQLIFQDQIEHFVWAHIIIGATDVIC